MYLLDTNVVIQILRGNVAVVSRLMQKSPRDCAISAIVAHELFYGAYKGKSRAENLARVEALRFEVLPFDTEDARCAGEVRALLALAGAPIGPYDVLIAGQALARSHVLVTHNVREFSRVPDLVYEDWAR
jgi:tRNA(fMet)-specific endonuclease VapC